MGRELGDSGRAQWVQQYGMVGCLVDRALRDSSLGGALVEWFGF